MSYMKGNLLSRTRKLVKGLAKPTPVWLKAMEEAPPVVFPRCDSKIQRIEMPEDVYVKRFFRKHPDSLYHDPVKISGFDPPPARVFAWRVVELKEQGVSEEEAMAVADMEYKAEKKAKKKAYSELKKVNRLQGKKPPPNPYPSAIKEIQAEEKKYVRDRFFNPKIIEIAKRLAEENPDKQADRMSHRNVYGGGRPGWLTVAGSGGRIGSMVTVVGSGGRPGWNNNFPNSENYTGGRLGGLGDNNFLRNNNFNGGGGRPGGWGNSNFLGSFGGGGGRPGGGVENDFPGENNNGDGGRPGGWGNSNFPNNSNVGNFSGGGGRPGGGVENNFPGENNNGDGGRPGGWGNSNFRNVGYFSGGGGRPGGGVENNFPGENNNGDGGRPGGWGNSNFRNVGYFSGGGGRPGGRPGGGVENNFPNNNNGENNNEDGGRPGGWGNINFVR